MKKGGILFFLISVGAMLSVVIGGLIDRCEAATVGNPLDLDIPAKSAILRQSVVEETLDEYEHMIEIKTGIDAEIVFDKDLNASGEITNPELEGEWYMAKLGVSVFNKIEPYVKLGTSHLRASWRQGAGGEQKIEVDADYGFAWGGGVKGVIWEFSNWGVRLTGDAQYVTTEPDADEISREGVTVNNPGADFKINEWQISLVLSKKFELPLRWQSIYIVPYTGVIVSDSTVDVKFTDANMPTTDYSLFDANSKHLYGFLVGCDIMPSLKSSFIYSIEARLVSEFALTLGGTMKF